jgi:hypothetical protein
VLVRALKVAVATMGLMILAGLLAVAWRMVELATGRHNTQAPSAVVTAPARTSSSAAEPAIPVSVRLPASATVRSTSLSGDKLSVHYETPEGSGVLILDPATGRVLSHVRFEPPR